MKELKNIDLTNNNITKESLHNSELIQISNKENDLNQMNNLNNETFNQINLSKINENDNENEIKVRDVLYGNNYLNYYLNNKYSSSKKCFNSKIKKMGNLHVYFFINDQPLIVLGNKNISLVIAYEIILQISFIILVATIINSIFFFLKYILIILYLNCFLCHIYIFLANPGIPSIDHYSKIVLKSANFSKMNEEQKKYFYICEVCNIIINYNENIEHCEECDICVLKLDHHCFWTGKCITKKNIWAFYCFSFGSMIYILWYFIIIIYYLVTQVGSENLYKNKKYL